ncbi:MAG: cysteine desulfurase [Rhodospirillales bacterium RIFCSPLOWO2_12_FULL_58_28]|nr:MAG: cysteine desulfurase [Rhodospirillales bacterium RIFCSPLOWO2_02_FULL_58_16]OHC77419.1 MAG: cysteine desulfurase [Rhodospirillales bacterium RIFCSPLOWO2_12_FULL_58_28]
MKNNAVYLDYNATAPVRPAAASAVAEAMAMIGNPSSTHSFGRAVRKAVEQARERVAALVNAPTGVIVFTGGGTEANNLALRGCGRRALVSAVEHDSVLSAVPDPILIPVDGDGLVDLEALKALLAGEAPAVASVMLANNETGVVQPIAAIAELAHRFGALIHCDAVQAAGKIPVDMAALGVDMLSISAHKIGGPPGVGALAVLDHVALKAVARGGGQERGLRGGTLNAPGIIGFGVAADLAGEGLNAFAGLSGLRDDLEREIIRMAPGVKIFGAGARRLPNTSYFSRPGRSNDTQVINLDLAGVAISAGSACSSGKVKASHVLTAMGVDGELASGAIRVSLGWTSTADHVKRFLAAWNRRAA